MARRSSMLQFAAVAGVAALALSACSSSTSSTSESSSAPSASADGVLKIGTVLPQTGSLAFLGPPSSLASTLPSNRSTRLVASTVRTSRSSKVIPVIPPPTSHRPPPIR